MRLVLSGQQCLDDPEYMMEAIDHVASVTGVKFVKSGKSMATIGAWGTDAMNVDFWFDSSAWTGLEAVR